MEKYIQEIRAERARQDKKFGEQNHSPIEFMAILAEEIGEVNKEIVDAHFGFAPKEKCIEKARVEFIQVAAMAYQCAEAISRQTGHECQFHNDECYSNLETEVKEFYSVSGYGTKCFVQALTGIGCSYGNACQIAMDIDSDEPFEGKVSIEVKKLADYLSSMYMIILMCVSSVHIIDKSKTGSNGQ